MTHGIGRVGAERTDAVASVIATAFHALAVAEWLMPDPVEREKVFPDYFRIFVAHAMEYGEVYATGDLAAVAVWFPATGEPAPPPAGYEQRVADLVGAHRPRFQAFDDLMDAHHPHDPHHYLAFLATLPDRQGTGLGAALLADHHARLDAAGVPAYLEASSPRSRDLYLRHGYTPRGEPYHLPDGPPMYPLWREPRG